MGEIGSGNGSSYPGTLDTDTTLETTSTSARSDVPNDLGADIVAIETELGTDPAGTKTDVKTYLQTEHSTDGTHSDITADSITVYGEKKWAKGADLASANALALGTDGDYFDITGTTAITSIGTVGIGTVIKLHFDGALTLTHNATDLVLPLGQDITTYAGLELELIEYASADWRLIGGINASARPSFSVHRNGTIQTNITGVNKIRWTTEDFDTNSDFSHDADDSGGATENRFTPTVAGKYLFTFQLSWESVTTGDDIRGYFYKNGSETRRYFVDAETIATYSRITVIEDANGSTDYFEIFAENGNRDTSDVQGVTTNTWWMGCKID